ncbi:unnamed protein product [Gordionus sp. m RMFG-2023]
MNQQTPSGYAAETIHEIIPGLFLAGYKEAADSDLMTKKGVTHIVSLTECPTKLYSNRESLIIPCKDILSQHMLDFIPRVNDYVHTSRFKGGKVLVHCMCGVSRGPTMVIAYLMSATNLTSQEAYNSVISLRTFICPNPSFRQQLVEYEISGALQQERIRLRSRYPVNDNTRNDEIICRERILKCLKDPSSPFFSKFPDFYFDPRSQYPNKPAQMGNMIQQQQFNPASQNYNRNLDAAANEQNQQYKTLPRKAGGMPYDNMDNNVVMLSPNNSDGRIFCNISNPRVPNTKNQVLSPEKSKDVIRNMKFSNNGE